MRKLLAVLLFYLLNANNAFSLMLPEEVRTELKRARIPLSSVGIVVRHVDSHIPLISLNGRQPMNPASTMKLLTTFAALETLGPAYRWKTEAYLGGTLENGILHGDLIFKGYGDPKLNIEHFWMWLRELRQRGLREIRGDIVLDCSFFEDIRHDPAEFDNDPTRAYNVGPNALLLNFNATRLRLMPEAGQTSVMLDPELSGYAISNHVRTSAKQPCNRGNTYSARIEERNIVLEGTIPLGCGEVEEYFSLLPHSEYFFAVFSSLWREIGGSLHGKLRAGNAPAGQAAFSTHYSPPLSEVIRDINKFSNNTMARQLFLTLGAVEPESDKVNLQQTPIFQNQAPAPMANTPLPEVASPGGQLYDKMEDDPESGSGLASLREEQPLRCDPTANIVRSTAAIQHWLSSRRLHFPELVLENGSGLSRAARISAQSLAELLQRAAHSPFSAELEASLPILGYDGTMRRRLKDNEIAGYAHLKTGMLEGVKSLAGYVKSHQGDQWILVFIINHPNARYGRAAQDAMVEWLQKQH